MVISSTISPDKKRVTIRVNGRFDFSVYREFRDAYRDLAGPTEYCVDLGGTDYMDSSALGMLMLLREHAQASNARVVLKGPTAGARKVLTIANFDKLFPVE
jgi:anti-anti-sigma factor